MCLAIGERPSRRNVNAVIVKQTGKGVRPQEIAAALVRIREPLGNRNGTTPGTTKPSQNGHSGTTPGTTLEPATLRDGTIGLFDDSLRSSSGVVKSSPAEKASKPRQLPLDRALLDSRNAILKALWGRIQPVLVSTTFSDWRKRNAKIATSFAELGWTPERLLKAWDHEARRGLPIRELELLQKCIEGKATKLAVLRAAQA